MKNVDDMIIKELLSLRGIRAQKCYGLNNSALVLELYSPEHKRLYFVFDLNPKTLTLHVQKEKPAGVKTKSPLILAFNKYGLNKGLAFLGQANASDMIKLAVQDSEHDLSLIFKTEPRFALGFFIDQKLVAASPFDTPFLFADGFEKLDQTPLGLAANFAQAQKYAEIFKRFYRDIFFHKQVKALTNLLAKKQKLLKNLQQDFSKCQKNMALKKTAELLQSNFHLLKRGQKQITVVDYETDPPQETAIELDAKFSPKEQLERIFNKIKRAKRGLAMIEPRINEAEDSIKKLKEEIKELKNTDPQSVSLEQALNQKQADFSSKKSTEARLPYKEFISPDGIKVWVGKSAKDSDQLTTRFAKGSEWWFHARDVPGAHVVVKSNVDALPVDTLLYAAKLAAAYSKDKNNTHCDVMYTKVHNVRKKKGLAAGLVMVSNEKTITLSR